MNRSRSLVAHIITSTVDQVDRMLFAGMDTPGRRRPFKQQSVAHGQVDHLDEAHTATPMDGTAGHWLSIQRPIRPRWCDSTFNLPSHAIGAAMTATLPRRSESIPKTVSSFQLNDAVIADPEVALVVVELSNNPNRSVLID